MWTGSTLFRRLLAILHATPSTTRSTTQNANSSTISSSDATKLQQTFSALLNQITTTSNAAKVDGAGLTASTATSLTIQTGIGTSDTTTLHVVKVDTTTLGINASDISTASGATAAITALKTALDTVSSNQSSVAADQVSLTSVTKLNASITDNLQNTIDSIQKPDAAQLQMDLQNMNNQQSMNYYLINQMNQEAQGVLTIFR